MLKETKHYPLLLDYTSWQDGQIGSVGQFNRNGTDSENSRVLDIDPWGKETVVWQAQNNDVTSNGDGGWNSTWINVDENYTYRFSTWVKRPNTGNGTFYFGCYASPTILNSSNLVANGNPYFHIAGGLTNDWILVVAHVHPSGTPAGTLHPDSGIYNIFDKIGNINKQDYIMAPGTTLLKHRSYLYYSTDPSTIQQWVYPRLDKCDGTEPSIKELLAGHDSRNIEMVRAQGGTISKPMTIDNNATFTEISEVGVTDKLIAWYPLTKDTNDYSGNAYDGTNSSVEVNSGGFQYKGSHLFNGTNSLLSFPYEYVPPSNNPRSISLWINLSGTERQIIYNSGNNGTLNSTFDLEWSVYHNTTPTGSGYFGIHYWGNGIKTNATIEENTLLHIVLVHDGGDISPNNTRIYKNNVPYPVLDTAPFDTTVVNANNIGGRPYQGGHWVNGSISNVKIFDKALTPEEISIEYKLGTNTKTHINNNKTYIQGQFKEI